MVWRVCIRYYLGGRSMLATVLEYVSLVIGVIGGAVIAWGVVVALVKLVRGEGERLRQKKLGVLALGHVRWDLGFHLLLGLEFLVAADVIRTIVHPSLEELAILGSLVAIRTVISHFLNKEIEKLGGRMEVSG